MLAASSSPYDSLPGAPGGFCELPRTDYNWTYVSYSTRSEYDLVCRREWIVAAARSAFFLGFGLGAMFWGRVADVVGRKRTMLFGLMS